MALTEEQCIQLVERVEMFPCSYDYSVKEYSSERAKSNARETVAKEIKLSGYSMLIILNVFCWYFNKKNKLNFV